MLDIPQERFFRPQASNDIGGAAQELCYSALANPEDYPPIHQFVFPGDSLSFVLLPNLSHPDLAAATLVEVIPRLLKDIQIFFVTSRPYKFENSRMKAWEASFKESGLNLNFVVHDADDSNASAMAAIDQRGEPIYINRTIFESDVVVPVGGPYQLDSTEDSIFPQFATRETLARLRSAETSVSQKRGEVRLVEEAIGVPFLIRMYSNPGGQITAIRAGEKTRLDDTPHESESVWRIPRQEKGKVVVTTIESQTQTWDQVLRALAVASQVSHETEQIVICSELDERPAALEKAILQLQFETDHSAAADLMDRIPIALRNIPETLAEKSVFLKSQLDRNDVEELGLGYIENEYQIQGIIDRAESGVFLRDAHLCEISEVENV